MKGVNIITYLLPFFQTRIIILFCVYAAEQSAITAFVGCSPKALVISGRIVQIKEARVVIAPVSLMGIVGESKIVAKQIS
jgi:hypothetical protein